MPSLSSFINSSQYSTESTNIPLIAGMQLGSTYNTGLSFNGYCGAAGNDPGGLFGWLTYARSIVANPIRGKTTDSYIVYTNPQDMVNDLDLLTGVTSCLVSATGAGGTYGLFQNNGTTNNVYRLSPRPAGNDFLYAISYLAYGGTLVVVGSTSGFQKYTIDSNKYLDVVIGQSANSDLCKFLINQYYTFGIFPTLADSTGQTGNSYSIANYTNLFGSANYVVTGSTVANRIFNVYGVKQYTDIDTTTLLSNSKITYTLPAVSDVGGFFTRAKNRKQQYLTVAGTDLGKVLNGSITNTIDWANPDTNTLRTNRVNFFLTYTPPFLGSDLIGATYSSSIGSSDRVGPSQMYAKVYSILNTVGQKYLFQINNSATRSQVTSAIQTQLEPLSPYLDTTQTQITCNATNNTDNSNTLTMSVVIKPIISINSFAINLSLTQ
jgi:hypothetical protein